MGPDGLTLMGLDDEADHDEKPLCTDCGQPEGLSANGEIIPDPNGEPVHVACLAARLEAARAKPVRVTVEIDLDVTDSAALERYWQQAHLARTGRYPAPTEGVVDALMQLMDWAACDIGGVSVVSAAGGRYPCPGGAAA